MLRRMLKHGLYVCAISILQPTGLWAQTSLQADTVQISLQEAENIFLEKNLLLIAEHYNVDANKALIQQAKLWDNPLLNTDQNVYSNKKFFEHGTNANGQPIGQYFIQVEQLIRTANKRGKQIKLATTNAAISQWQMNDVLRNLKLQLRTDYYTLVQLRGNQKLYNESKLQLEKLLTAMNAQYKAGNIARKDLLRIQALGITLEQEAAENDRLLSDTQNELKTLLQYSGDIYLLPTTSYTEPNIALLDKTALAATAKENNAYYRLQQMQLQYQQQNLSLQKALAVPDVTLAPNYDHNSNYTVNYYGLGISLPLPVLNRNQGNIKAARMQVKQSEAITDNAGIALENDVLNAYNKLQYMTKLGNEEQRDFYTAYDDLFGKIMQSYRDRQMSLLEFIDNFEAYKEIKQKQLLQQLNLQLAKEELNYTTGTDVVR